MQWRHHVKIKHLFTQKEDYDSLQESMTSIAGVIMNTSCFNSFDRDILAKFTHLHSGDDIMTPVDYANKLINLVYDYADDHAIWME